MEICVDILMIVSVVKSKTVMFGKKNIIKHSVIGYVVDEPVLYPSPVKILNHLHSICKPQHKQLSFSTIYAEHSRFIFMKDCLLQIAVML